MKNIAGGLLCVVGLVAVLGTACDDDDDSGGGFGGSGGSTATGGRSGGGGGTGGGGAATGGSGGTTGAPAMLTDSRIAGVMIEANAGEVHAAELALSRSTNGAVQAFATMMVTDHTASTMRMQALLDRKGLQAEDSALRQMVAAKTTQALNTLWSTPAGAFDVAYADSQVTMHTDVLGMLDNMLIPAAQDAELKAELQATRAAVATHLTHAQQLRASVAAGGGGNADGGTGQ